jgi:hypothetical protein
MDVRRRILPCVKHDSRLICRHHGNQVNLSHIVYHNIDMARTQDNYRVQGVFFRDYYPNGEWNIIRAPAMRNQKKYSCCSQPYYDITYALALKRKTLFYTVHLIIPCVGISLLTFVVFYLPSRSGEKIVLSISIELALTVIFPLLADLIPSTSIMIPLLGKYLLFIMILVTLSLINTIAILALYYRQNNQEQGMPSWMKFVFLQLLPSCLFLSSQHHHEQQSNVHTSFTIPASNTIDDVFTRMLEQMLGLEDLENIFVRYRTAIQHDQVKRRTCETCLYR